jgi:hypothetical protein
MQIEIQRTPAPTRPVRALVRVQTSAGPRFEWRDLEVMTNAAPQAADLSRSDDQPPLTQAEPP